MKIILSLAILLCTFSLVGQTKHYFSIGIEQPVWFKDGETIYYNEHTYEAYNNIQTDAAVALPEYRINYQRRLRKKITWNSSLSFRPIKNLTVNVVDRINYSNHLYDFLDEIRMRTNLYEFSTGFRFHPRLAPLNFYFSTNLTLGMATIKSSRHTTYSSSHEEYTFTETNQTNKNYLGWELGMGAVRYISDKYYLDYGISVNLGPWFLGEISDEAPYYYKGQTSPDKGTRELPSDNILFWNQKIIQAETLHIYLNIGINK